MSWLNVNLNESLSSIKGQLTNLASNVLAETSEDDSGVGKEQFNELQKLVSYQEDEIKRLQRENSDIMRRIASNTKDGEDGWDWDATEDKSEVLLGRASQDEEATTSLATRVQDLEREREELIASLEQLDLDCQSTTDKLVSMKDELQTENTTLKLQQEDLKKENSFLKVNIEQEHQRIKVLVYEKETKESEIAQLRSQLEELKEVRESSRSESVEIQNGESSIDILDYNKLKTLVEEYNSQIKLYEKELTALRASHDEVTPQIGDTSKNVSNKYFDILLSALNKIDGTEHPWITTEGDDEKLFENLVNNVVKIIGDYKWKHESVEEELQNVLSEKSLLLSEKSREMENLLENTKELNKKLAVQEKDIEHYKAECSALSRNNEALIKRLEDAKINNMALHTIPEVNEQIDGQLEKCFKRIEQLEREVDLKSNEEINELKCQLVLTLKQLEQAQKEIDEEKRNYRILEEKNGSLNVYLEGIRKKFRECYNQKEELEGRVKLDDENIAEKNLNLETLHEEVEVLTATIYELRRQTERSATVKEELERQLEEAHKEIEDLKEEMTCEIDASLRKDEQMHEFSGTVDQMEQNIRKLKRQVEQLSAENEELLMDRSQYVMNYRNFRYDVEKLIECYKDLKQAHDRDLHLKDEILKEKDSLASRLSQMDDWSIERSSFEDRIPQLEANIDELKDNNLRLISEVNVLITEKNKLESQVNELTISRNEVIQLVQQKHQESISYHQEIQRLQQCVALETEKFKAIETQMSNIENIQQEIICKNTEIEKLNDQNAFLREKCTVLAENLLQEQSNSQKILNDKSGATEREMNLQRQLDSLRQHLIEREEMYTKEVQTAEDNCAEMQKKLQAMVEKEKNSSNRFTSANIRANQQLETVQTNLQLVTNQRDELKRKVSDLEDQMEKQNAALCNLQIVLEQFQRDKDKVIFEETERIRRQVTHEKQVQNTLYHQITDLKTQLEESKEGLKAAVRLTDQVESSKRQVTAMKEEVAKLHEMLQKSEAKCDKLSNQTDGRVDKMLIKNLVIGLVTCHNTLNKDQNQILRIISTVLDFNQQDIEKVNLNKREHGTWFSTLLHPQALSDGQNNVSQDSLTQAFVKFLEAESKPRNLPNLLDTASTPVSRSSPTSDMDKNKGSANISRKTSTTLSPLLLNEVVLPTFSDFAANRNSSSILKNVLKDNNS